MACMWEITEITGDESRVLRQRYEPLTQSIRDLVDAALRTEVDDEVLRSARAGIDAATAQLSARLRDGSPGMNVTTEGESIHWGDCGQGPRNPFAPPLLAEHDGPTRGHLDVRLGAAYEGAPGHLHGGYTALVLDHLFGHVASRGSATTVAATGTITLRYHRPTRLGLLHAEAEIERREGRKIFLAGHLADADGTTVTAEGLFIELRQPGA